MQTGIDPDKLWTWSHYATGARVRHRCPMTLVILALDPAVAAWCRRPIDLGCGTVTPVVVGRESIPVIADIEEARRMLELAVLSVAAHADELGAADIAVAALVATQELDSNLAPVYADFIHAALSEAVRAQVLETLMQTGHHAFHSEIARQWAAQGRAEGEATILLKLLQLKGFAVPEELRQRILECTDCAQLEEWAGRVLTARSLEDVFLEG